MKRTYLYLLVALSFIACDSLEQIVEIDFPEHVPQLVLNAKVEAGGEWNVFLSKSRPIRDRGKFFDQGFGSENPFEDDAITDARILVKSNGAEYTTLVHIRNGVYSSDILPPEPGSIIEFEISAQGFNTIRVSDTIPELPSITSEAVLVENADNDLGQSRINFSFEDERGDSKDYYAIRVAQVNIDGFKDGLGFTLKNATRFVPNLDEVDSDASFYNLVVFGDDFFDGSTVEVDLDVSTFDSAALVEIQFEKVSESFFKYRSTLELQGENGDNPFAEPVQIYTNVEGGLGVLSSTAKKQIFRETVNSIDISSLYGAYRLDGGFGISDSNNQNEYTEEGTISALQLNADNSLSFTLIEPEGVLGAPLDLNVSGTWGLDVNYVEFEFDHVSFAGTQRLRVEVFDEIYLFGSLEMADGRRFEFGLRKE